MSKIALHGHIHSCSHSSGKIIVSGSKRPTINGIPIAIIGDRCECGSSVDEIVTGSRCFTVNGIPVAVTGSSTANGGVIIEGCSSLVITG